MARSRGPSWQGRVVHRGKGKATRVRTTPLAEEPTLKATREGHEEWTLCFSRDPLAVPTWKVLHLDGKHLLSFTPGCSLLERKKFLLGKKK